MPIAVLTARSDTMDSLMMLFMLLAGWCLVRAVSSEEHDLRWVCLAGLSLGLAFEIKTRNLIPFGIYCILFGSVMVIYTSVS